MVGATRKRLLLLICVFGLVGLLLRYLFHQSALLAVSNSESGNGRTGPQPESNTNKPNSVNFPNQQHGDFRHAPGAPVLVMVFYESLCPDSKHFILKQLLPAYARAHSLMEVQLVAYGKAQTFTNPDGTYRFDCQHGSAECEANIYHACATEIIEEPLKRLEVIACMIKDNHNPKEAMHKCAKEHNIENTSLIQKCYDSSHGAELHKLNGDATHALRPAATFIPTITLDGSQGRQPAILKNLLAEVCKIHGDTDEADNPCRHQ